MPKVVKRPVLFTERTVPPNMVISSFRHSGLREKEEKGMPKVVKTPRSIHHTSLERAANRLAWATVVIICIVLWVSYG